MSFFRRIRAAVGTGLTWAVVWGVAGAIASPLLSAFANARPDGILLNAIVFAVTIGWYGFLAGAVFSIILAVAGRRLSFNELTPARTGLLGIAASVLLTVPPMILMVTQRPDGWRVEDGVYMLGSLLLSTACATGTLLLARRAPPSLSEASLALDEVSPDFQRPEAHKQREAL